MLARQLHRRIAGHPPTQRSCGSLRRASHEPAARPSPTPASDRARVGADAGSGAAPPRRSRVVLRRERAARLHAKPAQHARPPGPGFAGRPDGPAVPRPRAAWYSSIGRGVPQGPRSGQGVRPCATAVCCWRAPRSPRNWSPRWVSTAPPLDSPPLTPGICGSAGCWRAAAHPRRAAFLAGVAVQQRGGNVRHVEGGDVAEDQHLQDWRHQQADQHVAVAPELVELLAHQWPAPREHASHQLLLETARGEPGPRRRRRRT